MGAALVRANYCRCLTLHGSAHFMVELREEMGETLSTGRNYTVKVEQ